MTILGIVGSLREKSYNKGLMDAAKTVLPPNVTLEVADIGQLPLLNQDFEQNLPEAVQAFKQQIERADALLIATPEYNYSISGVLKNAIDWGSRPYGKNSFAGKPAAIMSASIGLAGGMRAQYHLRQVANGVDMLVLSRPEVMVGTAAQKFDEQGVLTDEDTRTRIKDLLEALVKWTEKVR